MKKRPSPNSRNRDREVAPLEDLSPRHTVKGGAGPRVLGEPLEPPEKGWQDSKPDEERRP